MTRDERRSGADAVADESDDRVPADGTRADGRSTVRRATGRHCSMRSNPAKQT